MWGIILMIYWPTVMTISVFYLPKEEFFSLLCPVFFMPFLKATGKHVPICTMVGIFLGSTACLLACGVNFAVTSLKEIPWFVSVGFAVLLLAFSKKEQNNTRPIPLPAWAKPYLQ